MTANVKSPDQGPDVHRQTAIVCVDDFEREARESLPRNIFDYFQTGADEEVTLQENVSAFRRYVIYPRVLRDVSIRHTATTVLGNTISFPVCIAPMALHGMAHRDGELATARAAASVNTIFSLSTMSTVSMEDVASSVNGVRFFQLYVPQQSGLTEKLVERAEKAGYSAVIVTVDTPISGKRRKDHRNKLQLPSHIKLANFDTKSDQTFAQIANSLIDPTTSWTRIDWLRSITILPVLVKGIMTAEDAQLAIRHGVDGIIVSNHGGRQLDTVPATIDVLAEIVRAVAGRCEVYLDGGIRTGTDVFKALALGARAVFIGRPVLYGLAYNGENGVRQVLQILKDEFGATMALAGCASVAEIQPSFIRHRQRIANAML